MCTACGFLFVTLTLVQNEMWFALVGLVLHSAAVLWLGLHPAITSTRRR